MRQLLVPLLLTAALAACTPPPKPAADPGHRVQYSKEGKFEDVRDDLKTAIQNRGLVIDHTSHIHNMLERTGKDIGQTAKVFKDAEAFSFCSATVSRNTMEADPHNIVFCPYTITAYVTEKEPGEGLCRLPPAPTGRLGCLEGVTQGGARLARRHRARGCRTVKHAGVSVPCSPARVTGCPSAVRRQADATTVGHRREIPYRRESRRRSRARKTPRPPPGAPD